MAHVIVFCSLRCKNSQSTNIKVFMLYMCKVQTVCNGVVAFPSRSQGSDNQVCTVYIHLTTGFLLAQYLTLHAV